MDRQKLISVVIPAYNAQNTIKRCVDSVRKQTYTNIEILVVNDGGTMLNFGSCQACINEC